MLCKTCRFWRPQRLENHLDLGHCRAVPQYIDAVGRNAETGKPEFTKEASHRKAVTRDWNDVSSCLLTKPDFGCVQWESKPEPKPETEDAFA